MRKLRSEAWKGLGRLIGTTWQAEAPLTAECIWPQGCGRRKAPDNHIGTCAEGVYVTAVSAKGRRFFSWAAHGGWHLGQDVTLLDVTSPLLGMDASGQGEMCRKKLECLWSVIQWFMIFRGRLLKKTKYSKKIEKRILPVSTTLTWLSEEATVSDGNFGCIYNPWHS